MMMNRCTLVGVLAVAAAGLGGCTSGVSMDNQSDTWLNVRYYVATPSEAHAGSMEFVSVGRQQIKPGSISSFDLTSHPGFSPEGDSVVHVLVEPISPTWEEAPQYWLELLTPVPLSLSVSGDAGELTFSSEDAKFAHIPDQTREQERYQYTRITAPEPTVESAARGEDDSSPSEEEAEVEVAEVVDLDS